MPEILVSIIIPVFNGERFLAQAISSVLNQGLKEIELILINDGSTDGTENIISSFSNLDNRIVVIHTENKGVSAARNEGIKVAKGSFIGFVDADDYVHPNMYQELYEAAAKYQMDLVICNAMTVQDRHARLRLNLTTGVVNLEINYSGHLKDFLHFKYDYAIWNKIYSTGLLRKYGIAFDEHMCMWEDVLFNLSYLKCISSMVVINEGLYNYRNHTLSTMSMTKTKFGKNYTLFYTGYISFCESHNMNGHLTVFKKELSRNCIPTIFLLIKRSLIANAGFFRLFSHLKEELENLNPAIYQYNENEPAVKTIRHRLLQSKRLGLFSFFYVCDALLKDKIRPLKNFVSKRKESYDKGNH